MESTNQQVAKLIEQLPEDCSIEDVQYQLYVMETIRRRTKLADSGSLIPQTEVEKRMQEWLSP